MRTPGGAGLAAPAVSTRGLLAPTLFASALLAAALHSHPAVASPPDPRAAAAEEQRLAAARVASGAALRAVDADIAALQDQAETLSRQAEAAQDRLAQHAAALAPLLPLMERLSLYPVETLLAVPAPPEQALRGLAVMRGLARHLQDEGAALRAEAAGARTAAQAVAASLARLQAAQAVQGAQSAALDREIEAARAGRVHAGDAAAEMARRAAADAARADSVQAALAAMEAERARAEAHAREDAARAARARQDAAAADARRRGEALAQPAGPGLQDAPGPLFAPVAGAVVRGWGERTGDGSSGGVVVRPPPAARVTAPCAGRTAFAGPFRSYGMLLILDCGGGYHFVLSGFGRLDVAVGMAVQAGEPVGVMPEGAPAGPPGAAGRGGARATLYIELRRNGVAIDPAPFLRAHG